MTNLSGKTQEQVIKEARDRAVAAAPPLTSAQFDALAVLLNTSRARRPRQVAS